MGITMVAPRFNKILTPEALSFIEKLVGMFAKSREEILSLRDSRQAEIDRGILPNFTPEFEWIWNGDWTVSSIPDDLKVRRCEITGPASNREMVTKALNSPADGYMADAEDAEAPTWENIVNGQVNVYDAVRGTISYTNLKDGKEYKLNDRVAKLMFRPRGMHLLEKHILVNGKPVPAVIFDVGIFLFHNAKFLVEQGKTPALYLPKIESSQEAGWYYAFLCKCEEILGLKLGTVKVTVLIETFPAIFKMPKILYELRTHVIALNFGRWDYIFSFIKKLRKHRAFVLPDRQRITMDKHFLTSAAKLLVKTCRKHGAQPIGGMSTYIPVKGKPELDKDHREKIHADKVWERKMGFIGAWSAHPWPVSDIKEVFDSPVSETESDSADITADDLLRVPEGPISITLDELRTRIRTPLEYIDGFLNGTGCVATDHQMNDVATAEIDRCLLWSWLNGGAISYLDFTRLLGEETRKLNSRTAALASNLLRHIVTGSEFVEFLTIPAYDILLDLEKKS